MSVSVVRLGVVVMAGLALLLAWLSRRESTATGYLYDEPGGGWEW